MLHHDVEDISEELTPEIAEVADIDPSTIVLEDGGLQIKAATILSPRFRSKRYLSGMVTTGQSGDDKYMYLAGTSMSTEVDFNMI